MADGKAPQVGRTTLAAVHQGQGPGDAAEGEDRAQGAHILQVIGGGGPALGAVLFTGDADHWATPELLWPGRGF